MDESGIDRAQLGDGFLLGYEFKDVSSSDVARIFGQEFATQLNRFPAREWQGPVASGYGEHVVFIEHKTDGRVPVLAEVREAVKREWLNARQAELREQFYQNLLKRYTVIVERPESADTKESLARQ